MIDLRQVVTLNTAWVAEWHCLTRVENSYSGWLRIVCQQAGYNFALWHAEDLVRQPRASDMQVAAAKRNIDQLNQMRNDAIEELDRAIAEMLAGVAVGPDAPLNTETLGSVIDRLAILALRIYHLKERGGSERLAIARQQLVDLTRSGQQLADDLFAGRRRHKVFRALKMYNDPTTSA